MNTSQPNWLLEMEHFAKEAWQQSGFTAPTQIQSKTIPFILEGKDVIAEAPTGSGKTLAYLLPLLQKIDTDKKHTQVLILASSHELVMQIHQEIQNWAKGSGINSIALIGGANVKRQIDKLKKKPQIAVGTPGRIYELMQKKKLKAHEIKTLVFDEADQLLVPEHRQTVEDIVKSTQKDRQVLLFSATLPEEVQQTAKAFMDEPEIVQVAEEQLKPDVEHVYIFCEDRDKVELLRKLAYLKGFKGLAFMQDIANLNVYAEKLKFKKLPLEMLHSDTKKEQRAKALKGFRKDEYPLLLATDVAARGLDIKDITYIVNLDVPKSGTSYIHRAGRTARLGALSGTVVSLVNQVEEKRLKKFARDYNFTLQERTLYRGELRNK
ncbi:DEAD/DEAH box helicase [Halobacillus massiliensis]|uniref:DEAD/DEAH box helicase n=1 Tax=Halobacillus massiliensis TaxID=1926286 RepID=UPI0009E4CCC5|nr:DEAD/DEAH box helicase [Halobacillus massiliensis]